MIKIYSTVTNKYYDSAEEATAAEKKISDEAKAKEDAQLALTKKVDEIKKQRDAEVKAQSEKLNDLTKQIEDLIKKRDIIKTNIQRINEEAEDQIYDLKLKDFNDKSECSIKVKTFDSTKDNDWQTVVDEHGKYSDVEKKLKSMRNTNTELKKLLTYFNI